MVHITRTLVGGFQSLLRGGGEGVLGSADRTRAVCPELNWLYNNTESECTS
jgi:hypothetical protein